MELPFDLTFDTMDILCLVAATNILLGYATVEKLWVVAQATMLIALAWVSSWIQCGLKHRQDESSVNI